MAPDTPCPPADLLRRSLDPDDAMAEPERQRIETHVGRCDKGCKEVIDALLRGGTLPLTQCGTEPGDAAVAWTAAPPAFRSPTLPGYEILEEIARGGMGVVYKARQTQLDRLAAVKMILGGAGASPDSVARFRVEAEAVARLRHPNIVQIYEVGESDGLAFLALEYVEGGSLAQRIARTPPSARVAAELVETLARAVHFAHQQGVLHRDLKPANVLLAADGAPKIADFGLAKRLGSDAGRTRTGEILGTPSYMAPEQAAPGSAPMGTPADVWALGVILYEMLSGRPPFQGETPWDVLTLVVSAEPPSPRRLRPKTPADLETICLKCLRKEPQRRYGSAEALADDLRRFLTDRPIQARRVGVAERAVKWVRRNAVLTVLLAVAVLASAGGAGGWLWAALDRAARQAEADRLAAARRSAAEHKADVALARAQEDEDQAADLERAADARGKEEPETPETAKQALDLRRQAEAALDEAERALADVLGTQAAQVRTAQRRQASQADLRQAEKVAALLGDLDRARAARAELKANHLDTDAVARSYVAGVSAYGLDVSKPEEETAAEIREARPAVRLALVLALDDWASSIDAADAERMRRIAGEADDDDWRRRYRAAVGDVSALKRLAEEAPGLHLPAVSMILLGRDLYSRGARSEAATLLRAARRQHPSDFWVYFDLDDCLSDPDHPNPATLNEEESCACAAVAIRPDSGVAHYNLGLVLREQGDLVRAAECYKKAIELDPKYVSACINLGSLLRDRGDQAGAVEYARKAVELDPGNVYALNNLGNSLGDQGDLPGAAASIRKAIELDPKYALGYSNLGNVLREQGDLAGAAAACKTAIELDPKFADAHNNLGNVLDAQGDRDGAAACYKKAIELDPKHAFAHYNLGNVLYHQGDLPEAAENYKKASELDPKYAPSRYNLGLVLYDQGNLAGAAGCYKKAIELDPTLAVAHIHLGNVLRDQGDLPGAAACFKKAVELDPKDASARTGLGNVLLDQGDREGAAAAFKKAIELDPKDAYAPNGLGNVLLDQGDRAGAAACYKKAIELDPKFADAHNNLGLVLYDQGDLPGATACYKKAIELDPKFAPAHSNLGNVLRDQGDLPGAVECHKKAVELNPKDANAPYNLGLALHDQGKYAEARKAFQHCLDLLVPNAPLHADAEDQIRQCERLLALEPKLAAVLKGEQQPADDAERIDLATVCYSQHRYAAAARFCRDAFAGDPKLADNLDSGNRFNAAWYAAQAGCGLGEDARDLDDKARAGWRKQALDWLRADLDLQTKQVDSGKPQDRKAALGALRNWQADPALAGLRDATELAKLPADEQEAWRKLWSDVQSIVDTTGEKK